MAGHGFEKHSVLLGHWFWATCCLGKLRKMSKIENSSLGAWMGWLVLWGYLVLGGFVLVWFWGFFWGGAQYVMPWCGISVSSPGIESRLQWWNHWIITTRPPGNSPVRLVDRSIGSLWNNHFSLNLVNIEPFVPAITGSQSPLYIKVTFKIFIYITSNTSKVDNVNLASLQLPSQQSVLWRRWGRGAALLGFSDIGHLPCARRHACHLDDKAPSPQGVPPAAAPMRDQRLSAFIQGGWGAVQ